MKKKDLNVVNPARRLKVKGGLRGTVSQPGVSHPAHSVARRCSMSRKPCAV